MCREKMIEKDMQKLIHWLLSDDVSIAYLTHLLLLNSSPEILAPLQARIEKEGFGARFLSNRQKNGHWGNWFHQPKWTCTHYTLADLKVIGMPAYSKDSREMIFRAFEECIIESCGINFAKTKVHCDAL